MSAPDDHEIQLTHRRRVAISGLMAAMSTDTVHEHRAVLLLHGILMEEARMLDNDDEYGTMCWDPDGWEFQVEIDERAFTVKIEEVE